MKATASYGVRLGIVWAVALVVVALIVCVTVTVNRHPSDGEFAYRWEREFRRHHAAVDCLGNAQHDRIPWVVELLAELGMRTERGLDGVAHVGREDCR